MLNAVVGSDAATVRGFANGYLVPADLGPGGLSATRAAALQAQIRTIVAAGQILRDRAPTARRHRAALRHRDLRRARSAEPGLHRRRRRGRSRPGSTRSPMRSPSARPCPRTTSCARTSRSRSTARSSRSSASGETRHPSSVTSTAFVGRSCSSPCSPGPWRRSRCTSSSARPSVRILRQTDQLLEATTPGPDDRHAQPRGPGRRAGRRDRRRAPDRARRWVSPCSTSTTSGASTRRTAIRRAIRHSRRSPTLLRDMLPADARWGRYGPDEFLVIVDARPDDRPGTDDRARPDPARRPQPAVRRRPSACRSRSAPGSAPSRSTASR